MSNIKKNIIVRFGIVYFIISLAFLAIIGKVIQIQYIEGDRWKTVDKQNKRDSIAVPASRGNIYSGGGKLMASSIPYYKLYMDFSVQPFKEEKVVNGEKIIKYTYKDTLNKYIDSLAYCLSIKLKDKSAAQYKQDILAQYNKVNTRGQRNRRYLLYPKEVSYVDLQEIKEFPFFRKGQYKSGFYTEDRLIRVRPFGSLALRTIGDIYGIDGRGRSGLEMGCDKILTGKDGISTRQKVAGERISLNQVEPVDGIDVVTTINIDMQDIADQALRNKLTYLNADEGCVILMDVKTGEIKAIANLVRRSDGLYYEDKNVAFGSKTEPGSTFKVASMMVALENNITKPTDSIDTKDGKHKFYGVEMKDHNWDKGGYGKISIADVIKYSSNIGMARIIDEYYHKNPEKFVEGLYDIGLNKIIDYDNEIPGSGKPFIPNPKDKTVWDRTDGTKLAWMSIGYNTQIPPIYTLMFYNAIANNGKMIKPFIVKHYKKDGDIIKTFKTEIVHAPICSMHTLDQIKVMLESVVESGTATAAKSNSFKIAGKTGTAQLNYGSRNRVDLKHQVSFCGYFPADNPMYSCIVLIKGPKVGYVSGGLFAGTVFKEVAEKVYARSAKLPITPADTSVIKMPASKNGNYKELKTVFSKLDISTDNHLVNDGNYTWVKTSISKENITLAPMPINYSLVPNVVGMCAKDAVYLIENAGMKVGQIIGSGTVKNQSAQPNSIVTKGQRVTLTLK